MHVHLAATLPDDTHDTGVGYGTLDSQSFVVQLLQSLGVLLLGVHLNLKCVHFQQLGPFLQILAPIRILTCPARHMELILICNSFHVTQ